MARRPEVTQTVVVADRKFEAGSFESTGFVIPDGVTALCMRAVRRNWPIGDGKHVINCQAWVSYDGGRKYHFLVGFRAQGGDHIQLDGVIAPESSAGRHIKPQYKTNDRMFKVVVVAEKALDAQILVEMW